MAKKKADYTEILIRQGSSAPTNWPKPSNWPKNRA